MNWLDVVATARTFVRVYGYYSMFTQALETRVVIHYLDREEDNCKQVDTANVVGQ